MTRPPKPTVVVALHDGFYGCGTGAGRSNRALLHVIANLLPTDVRLVVLPVHLDPTSYERDPAWHAQTLTLLAHVDTVVHPLDNGTAGQARFGGLDCFRHLVHHTAEVLTRCVLPDAHPLLILALDAPFLGLPPLLPTPVVANLVLVPRSTARIHTPAWSGKAIKAPPRGPASSVPVNSCLTTAPPRPGDDELPVAAHRSASAAARASWPAAGLPSMAVMVVVVVVASMSSSSCRARPAGSATETSRSRSSSKER